MRSNFLGPVARVSLGLIALIASVVLLADVAFDLLPQRAERELAARQRVVENLAAQIAVVLEAGDTQLLGKSLQQTLTFNRDVLSVAVRRSDGGIVLQRGDHARHWAVRETERSRWDHLQVPLYARDVRWGQMEMTFTPAGPRHVWDWLHEPVVWFYALLLLGGFVLSYIYLRRVMQHLDPAAAVPERVRAAFDTLADAVLVLDAQGRIMLFNRAFSGLHPDGAHNMDGHRVSEIKWLPRQTANDSADLPWDTVLRGKGAAPDERMSIVQPNGMRLEVVVRASPVGDAAGKLRGCIVTFHDITEVHAANDRLRATLGDLERTRQQIHTQNEELRRLAMRDPMTGCLNRRAFYDTASELYAASQRGDARLCCIMTDIDHFKGFNDLYGHSVGDQVIQVVARSLAASIRNSDLLCRYGGEEFCILLPDTDLNDACLIAERAREAIEAGASAAIRNVKVRKITASFGVATLADDAGSLQELIDQADQALYDSKESGRNRVRVWAQQQEVENFSAEGI